MRGLDFLSGEREEERQRAIWTALIGMMCHDGHLTPEVRLLFILSEIHSWLDLSAI